MQYTQRKLQRSVTEIRRSRIGRASVSSSLPPEKCGAAKAAARAVALRPGWIGMTFINKVFLPDDHSRRGYSSPHVRSAESCAGTEPKNGCRDHAPPSDRESLAGGSLGAARRDR